jgi:hypothetical protein
MKILSVFGSVPQVIKRLRLFLEDNRFYHVKVDPESNEITAERKSFLLWRDYVHLKVKASKENISNIELKVNPLHPSRSDEDEAKELNLQTKIYLYF